MAIHLLKKVEGVSCCFIPDPNHERRPEFIHELSGGEKQERMEANKLESTNKKNESTKQKEDLEFNLIISHYACAFCANIGLEIVRVKDPILQDQYVVQCQRCGKSANASTHLAAMLALNHRATREKATYFDISILTQTQGPIAYLREIFRAVDENQWLKIVADLFEGFCIKCGKKFIHDRKLQEFIEACQGDPLRDPDYLPTGKFYCEEHPHDCKIIMSECVTGSGEARNKKKVNESVKEKRMTPAETLFGFIAWITSLEEPVVASADHGAGIWADMAAEFCEANGIREPVHKNWFANLSFPDGRSTFPRDCKIEVNKMQEVMNELQEVVNKTQGDVNKIENPEPEFEFEPDRSRYENPLNPHLLKKLPKKDVDEA